MSLAPAYLLGLPESLSKNRGALDQPVSRNLFLPQMSEEENKPSFSNKASWESIPSLITDNQDSSQMNDFQPNFASLQLDIMSFNTPSMFQSDSLYENTEGVDLPKHPIVPHMNENENMTLPSNRAILESTSSLITNNLDSLQMSAYHPSIASFQLDITSLNPPRMFQQESFYKNMGGIDPFVAHMNKEEKKTPFSSRTLLESAPNSITNDPEMLHWRFPVAAATTRAARKRRMARQRRIIPYQSHITLKASTSSLTWSSVLRKTNNQIVPSITYGKEVLAHTPIQRLRPEANLRFLLQKELKPSDVGNLGRIILPKKDAEANLPYLAMREGIVLPMEDVKKACTWSLRYRFWPNNKSRMYLLENTGDFIKAHHLQEGDLMIIYKDDFSEKYIIRAKKVAQLDSATVTCGRRNRRCSAVQGKQIVIGDKGSDTGSLFKNIGVNVGGHTVNSSGQVSNNRAAPKVGLPMEENFEETLFRDFVHCLPEVLEIENDNLPQLEYVSGIETNDMPIEEIFDLKDQR